MGLPSLCSMKCLFLDIKSAPTPSLPLPGTLPFPILVVPFLIGETFVGIRCCWDGLHRQLQHCVPYPIFSSNTASGCAALQGKKNVFESWEALLTVCTLRSNLSDSSPTCPNLHFSGTKFSRNKNHLHSFR
jgi:hypothetical protein